jgi:hypothetical protein
VVEEGREGCRWIVKVLGELEGERWVGRERKELPPPIITNSLPSLPLPSFLPSPRSFQLFSFIICGTSGRRTERMKGKRWREG